VGILPVSGIGLEALSGEYWARYFEMRQLLWL
jgi:hypothetical protein